MLQITESIGKDFRRYSYHLHDEDVIIRRWDNAPHWKKVRTYPFHAHIKDREEPVESNVATAHPAAELPGHVRAVA